VVFLPWALVLLDQSKVMKEDGLGWAGVGPCSWLISSGHFGFVRVDDQFGSSPFYSGPCLGVFFWPDAWLAAFAFCSFSHFV